MNQGVLPVRGVLVKIGEEVQRKRESVMLILWRNEGERGFRRGPSPVTRTRGTALLYSVGVFKDLHGTFHNVEFDLCSELPTQKVHWIWPRINFHSTCHARHCGS
ncbi:hypothetical protein HAX54_038293 [Datura stramonium]|uniref:Uncharacterized protein n=1 Tax=Datura stramonium TaxID=4076 RepID=A0ABS8VKV0_DATST|nr:hypothetical protein [Datura stramonium]